MKRLLGLLSIMAVSALLSVTPLLAADQPAVNNEGKDMCMLVAATCKDNVDSIIQRIDKLNKEIAKGDAVYTKDELRILNKKLDETNKLLVELTTS